MGIGARLRELDDRALGAADASRARRHQHAWAVYLAVAIVTQTAIRGFGTDGAGATGWPAVLFAAVALGQVVRSRGPAGPGIDRRLAIRASLLGLAAGAVPMLVPALRRDGTSLVVLVVAAAVGYAVARRVVRPGEGEAAESASPRAASTT